MKKIVVALFIMSFLVGCSYQPQVQVMRYTTQVFTPTYNVEVLHNKPVSRDYIEIAQLTTDLQEDSIIYLKEYARQLGADAIVVLGESTRGTVFIPALQASMPLRDIHVVAIKYK